MNPNPGCRRWRSRGVKTSLHFVEVAYAWDSPLSPIRSLSHKLSPETANRERISHIMGFVSGSSGDGRAYLHTAGCADDDVGQLCKRISVYLQDTIYALYAL